MQKKKKKQKLQSLRLMCLFYALSFDNYILKCTKTELKMMQLAFLSICNYIIGTNRTKTTIFILFFVKNLILDIHLPVFQKQKKNCTYIRLQKLKLKKFYSYSFVSILIFLLISLFLISNWSLSCIRTFKTHKLWFKKFFLFLWFVVRVLNLN